LTASRASVVCGGDDAVHAVALQRGRDDLHLGCVQVGRNLHKDRNALAMLADQNLAALRDGP
jgi:hypothetical protein